MLARTSGVGITIILVLLLGTRASAEWRVVRTLDEFTDEETVFAVGSGDNQRIRLAVSCADGEPAVLITLLVPATFGSGDVEARWDDGAIESYSFTSLDTTLIAAPVPWSGAYEPKTEGLITKLARHTELRLRITKGDREQLTDRIDLEGSSAALGDLDCIR